MINAYRIVFISLVLLLTACGGDVKPQANMTEKELYLKAQEYLKEESWGYASTYLQELETRYPFGPYAEQSQLELIYAHYLDYDQDKAASVAERFIRLHPESPNADYAYYMKGLSNYTEGEGIFERFLPTDMTQRDPGPALQSFDDFRQLLLRFPTSQYNNDARARMIYLRDRLARHEIEVANYYFQRKAYIAAVNRGRYVVENYPQAAAIPDALAVQVQGYRLLNLNDLANDNLIVLRTNYPQYYALDAQGNFIDQYDPERSWMNKMTLGLIDPQVPPHFDDRDGDINPSYSKAPPPAPGSPVDDAEDEEPFWKIW
jgi:outer membrane protein assembly factor BamD